MSMKLPLLHKWSVLRSCEQDTLGQVHFSCTSVASLLVGPIARESEWVQPWLPTTLILIATPRNFFDTYPLHKKLDLC